MSKNGTPGKSPFSPRPGGGGGRNGNGKSDRGGAAQGGTGPSTRSSGSGAARPAKRPGGGKPPRG